MHDVGVLQQPEQEHCLVRSPPAGTVGWGQGKGRYTTICNVLAVVQDWPYSISEVSTRQVHYMRKYNCVSGLVHKRTSCVVGEF